ncbi:hypothetical protein [Streptomyces hydrogenans]|uniref:hypothetical protein n=1 Tax=Streptomyces hydrogenans TaxID=1873719 RepID=UPI00382D4B55
MERRKVTDVHPDTKVYADHVKTPRQYTPTGYAYAAFRETISTQSTYARGYITGCEADHMLTRAVRKGRVVFVHSYGALVITTAAKGAGDHARMTARTVTLQPVAAPKLMTRRQYDDLKLIDRSERHARLEYDDNAGAAIVAGMLRIPPRAAWILRRRGWISEQPHSGRVWISAAGRMAMTWQWHREQGLNYRLLKGLYLDAALTAAATARTVQAEHRT